MLVEVYATLCLLVNPASCETAVVDRVPASQITTGVCVQRGQDAITKIVQDNPGVGLRVREWGCRPYKGIDA